MLVEGVLMVVPYSIGRKIILSEEDSKFVVSLLTDQSVKIYQREGDHYVRRSRDYIYDVPSEDDPNE